MDRLLDLGHAIWTMGASFALVGALDWLLRLFQDDGR